MFFVNVRECEKCGCSLFGLMKCNCEEESEEKDMYKKGDRVVCEDSTKEFHFVGYDYDCDIIVQFEYMGHWESKTLKKKYCRPYKPEPEIKSFWLWIGATIQAPTLHLIPLLLDEEANMTDGSNVKSSILCMSKFDEKHYKVNMETGEIVE